jgi:hypothetical protein
MVSTNLNPPLTNFIIRAQALAEIQSSLDDVRLHVGDMRRHVSSPKIVGENKDQPHHACEPYIRYGS